MSCCGGAKATGPAARNSRKPDILAHPTEARALSAGTQPGERDDWPLEDPKGQPVEQVRRIREEVRSRVSELLAREGWTR